MLASAYQPRFHAPVIAPPDGEDPSPFYAGILAQGLVQLSLPTAGLLQIGLSDEVEATIHAVAGGFVRLVPPSTPTTWDAGPFATGWTIELSVWAADYARLRGSGPPGSLASGEEPRPMLVLYHNVDPDSALAAISPHVEALPETWLSAWWRAAGRSGGSAGEWRAQYLEGFRSGAAAVFVDGGTPLGATPRSDASELRQLGFQILTPYVSFGQPTQFLRRIPELAGPEWAGHPLTILAQDMHPSSELDVLGWLDAPEHSMVAHAIVWTRPGDVLVPFSLWSAEQRRQLEDDFAAILAGAPLGLEDPPPNLHPYRETSGTAVDTTHAWRLYVSHVANSIALELTGGVPWSLTHYSGEELFELLDARAFFTPILGDADADGEEDDPLYAIEYVVPAPPDFTMSFIRDAGIIGSTRRETILNLLEWCRILSHFTSDPRTGIVPIDPIPINQRFEQIWQYEGVPPVSRTINGTIDTELPDDGVRHWTAGCHGTTGLLRAVLRVVNIPVAHRHAFGHSLPYFITEKLYATHGDDFYSAFRPNQSVEIYAPPEGILIEPATFREWFEEADDKVGPLHVGRGPREWAIRELPVFLLSAACYDRNRGLSHADSEVYRLLGGDNEEPPYSIGELEERGLWIRLEARIDEVGCLNIPFLPFEGGFDQ